MECKNKECEIWNSCLKCLFFQSEKCEERRLKKKPGKCFYCELGNLGCNYIKGGKVKEAWIDLEERIINLIDKEGPKSINKLANTFSVSRVKTKKVIEGSNKLELMAPKKYGEGYEVRVKI